MMEEPEATIDYQGMVLKALLDVPRQALAYVAENGMPGEHHFYISFRTGHPEVQIPRFLRDQFPDEVTVILQNQFWSLLVDQDLFSVVLSFGGRRHPLTVPFAALTAFADPSATFMLRFDGTNLGPAENAEAGEGAESGDGGVPHKAQPKGMALRKPDIAPAGTPPGAGAPPAIAPGGEPAQRDVLRFDPTRRK